MTSSSSQYVDLCGAEPSREDFEPSRSAVAPRLRGGGSGTPRGTLRLPTPQTLLPGTWGRLNAR